MTECQEVWEEFLRSWSNVNLEIDIDQSNNTPTAPQLEFCLTNPEPNEYFISLSLFQDFNCNIEPDSLLSTISGSYFTKSQKY
jgi:hypothetical protein